MYYDQFTYKTELRHGSWYQLIMGYRDWQAFLKINQFSSSRPSLQAESASIVQKGTNLVYYLRAEAPS